MKISFTDLSMNITIEEPTLIIPLRARLQELNVFLFTV